MGWGLPILGASTSRTRARVPLKSRLQVIQGSIDDDLLSLEDDEEKARAVSTAGVDIEDATELHLLAVLSAASRQNNFGSQIVAFDASGNKEETPCIPVPDSTGIIDNYEELYKPNQWQAPATYIRFSQGIDEYCDNALANQLTYYLDERDAEWLERNNKFARGEGTSVQGTLLEERMVPSLYLSRGVRATEKDTDPVQPLEISQDEFELVMGIYETTTQEQAACLPNGFEPATLPFFSDYYETFARPLQSTLFSAFAVPLWVPSPDKLIHIARVIFPHWVGRRNERGGRRIIPGLNLNGADVENESYVCFRFRRGKSYRKTRVAQTRPSEKLTRLDSNLFSALGLAQYLLSRETVKQQVSKEGWNVWEKRRALVDLQMNFSTLCVKDNKALFFDKVRVSRRRKQENVASCTGLRLGSRGAELASSTRQLGVVFPKERTNMIKSEVEQELVRLQNRDRQWEDRIDNPYRALQVPFSSRLFKYIPPPSRSLKTSGNEHSAITHRSIRLRIGRGGRMIVDRRQARCLMLSSLNTVSQRRNSLPLGSDLEESERLWRLQDRWKYDADDSPSVEPDGGDEQHRVLIDDYSPKYLRHTMTLLHDEDAFALMSDPTLMIPASDGCGYKPVIPFSQRQPAIHKPFQRSHLRGIPPLPPIGTQLLCVSSPQALIHNTPAKTHAQPNASPPIVASNGRIQSPGHTVIPSMQVQQPMPTAILPTTNESTEQVRSRSPSNPGPQDKNVKQSQSNSSSISTMGRFPDRANSRTPPEFEQPQHCLDDNRRLLLNDISPPSRSSYATEMSTRTWQDLPQTEDRKIESSRSPPDVPSRQFNNVQRIPGRSPSRSDISVRVGPSSKLKALWSHSSPQRAMAALDGLDSLNLRSSSSPSPNRLSLYTHEPISPSPLSSSKLHSSPRPLQML